MIYKRPVQTVPLCLETSKLKLQIYVKKESLRALFYVQGEMKDYKDSSMPV